MKTETLQKRIWYLPSTGAWVTQGTVKEEERKFYLNELDVEITFANQKMEILTNYDRKLDENNFYKKTYRKSYGPHDDEILDVCEITRPDYVLTGSLDKIIRVFSFLDASFYDDVTGIVRPVGKYLSS